MLVRILENSVIKHDGDYLEPLEIHDLPEDVAKQLIASGDARPVEEGKIATGKRTKADKTKNFDPKANGGYVAEAVIDPAKRAKLDEEGKLNDATPVTGKDNTVEKDNTPEPEVETEVLGDDGKPLSPEEIKAREAAAAAGAPSDPDKTTVEELQNSGQEVK